MSKFSEKTPIISGTEAGIDWKVLLAPMRSSANGYVVVPADHPWFGKHYDDIEAEVHGGLTFADEGWFGFDTAHFCDEWSDAAVAEIGGTPSPYSFTSGGGDEYSVHWDLETIVAETKSLARQAAEASA